MKHLLPLICLMLGTLFSLNANAQVYEWTGAVSTEWEEPDNWQQPPGSVTPGFPAVGDIAEIQDGKSRYPVLENTITVGSFYLKGGEIDMNENTMIVLSEARFQGGMVTGDANFLISNIARLNSTTFENLVIMNKFGDGPSGGQGGNTFLDRVIFINSGGSRLRLGNNNPDLFEGPAEFVALMEGFEISYGGGSLFEDDIIITNSSGADFQIGREGAPDVLLLGRFDINSFLGGDLALYNVVQTGGGTNAAMEEVNPESFVVKGGQFTGDWAVEVSSMMELQDVEMLANNELYAGNIPNVEGCTFSALPGTQTAIEKTAASTGADTWNGNNTFHEVTLVNASPHFLITGQQEADDYLGNVSFQRMGSGDFQPAFRGDNNFYGDMEILGEVTLGKGIVGRVMLVGDTDQNINTNGTDIPLIHRLTVNKPGGMVNVNGPVDVNKELELVQGMVNTTSDNFLRVWTDEAVVSLGDEDSFINGPMVARHSRKDPVTLVFPIGRDGIWRPVELTIEQEEKRMNDYTVEMVNSSPNDLQPLIPGGDLATISDVRHWIVETEGATGLKSAAINLFYGDDDGVVDAAVLRVAQDVGDDWVSLCGTGTGTPSGSILSTLDPDPALGVFTLGTAAETGSIAPLAETPATGTGVAAGLNVEVYPNPASEFVRIESAQQLENPTVQLFDHAGRQVPLQFTAQDFQMDLQVNNLPSGVYFLKVISDAGAITRQLVLE